MAKLSSISKIADGLYISPINSKFININSPISIPFQITDPNTLLSCTSSVSITRDNAALFTNLNMSLSGTAPNCVLNLLPSPSLSGVSNFILSVTDGTDVSSSNFSVTVLSNPPSVTTVLVPVLFNEDTSQTFTLNYIDLEGDLATSCSTTAPLFATISTPCACDGAGVCRVTIQGNPNANGLGQFDFTVTDDDGPSSAATMNYNIVPVNDAPTFPAIADISITSNSVSTYDVDFSPSDIDLDLIDCSTSVNVTNSNSNIISSIAKSNFAGCRLTLTLAPNAIGTTIISVTVSDGALSATDSFNFTLTGWGQEAFIKASNPDAGDWFGSSIALDGDTLVVGAPREDGSVTGVRTVTTTSDNVVDGNFGAAYVFRRTGSAWVQEAFLKADSNIANHNYGTSVALSQNLIAVGSPNEDSAQTTITISGVPGSGASAIDSGAVYIYSRIGTTWTREAFIKAELNSASNLFGSTLFLSDQTLAVGVPKDDFNGTSIISGTAITLSTLVPDSGATYIYRRSAAGTWTREALIKANNRDSLDQFGTAVSLEGNLLAVGASFEGSNQTTITPLGSADNTRLESGAAYVYARNGTAWTQEAYIKAPNSESGDRFGTSVSISNNRLAVGAPLEDSNAIGIANVSSSDNSSPQSGAVYTFKKTGSSWSFENYIKYGAPLANTRFGQTVSLKGNTLVVGVDEDDFSTGRIVNGGISFPATNSFESGSSLVYRLNGSAWVEDAYLKALNFRDNYTFGNRVSISGDTIAVSSISESSNQNFITNSASAPTNNTMSASGAVYVFRNNARLFDVTEILASSSDTVISLSWQNPGGTTSDYVIKYINGTTAPAACNRTTDLVQAGTTFSTLSSVVLSPNTDYTFRICASNGTSVTDGKILKVRTNPAGSAVIIPAEVVNVAL